MRQKPAIQVNTSLTKNLKINNKNSPKKDVNSIN